MVSASPQEVYEELKKGSGAVLLDVRTPEEIKAMSISGALTIPVSEVEQRAGELTGHQKVFVFCLAGGRSSRATRILEAAGIPAVNMAGGITEWNRAGLPVERS